MKKQVFYIHGGSSFSKKEDFLRQLRTTTPRNKYGAKSKLWPDDLRVKLEDTYETFTPTMPNSQNANYEEWAIWFERHFQYLRDEVVFIGWSLGGMFLAKYLAEHNVPFKIKSLILLAAPCGEYMDESGDDCGTFRFKKEILGDLGKKVSNIQIWHSKDDFVVPYEHALEFMKYLPSAKLVSFEDRNHFLQEEFPELIEEIRRVG